VVALCKGRARVCRALFVGSGGLTSNFCESLQTSEQHRDSVNLVRELCEYLFADGDRVIAVVLVVVEIDGDVKEVIRPAVLSRALVRRFADRSDREAVGVQHGATVRDARAADVGGV